MDWGEAAELWGRVDLNKSIRCLKGVSRNSTAGRVRSSLLNREKTEENYRPPSPRRDRENKPIPKERRKIRRKNQGNISFVAKKS